VEGEAVRAWEWEGLLWMWEGLILGWEGLLWMWKGLLLGVGKASFGGRISFSKALLPVGHDKLSHSGLHFPFEIVSK
jgi:hypothetical protein